MPTDDGQSFEDLKTRLDEIVSLVSDDSLPLDEALDLYEEAVGIGLAASRIMEQDITAQDAQDAKHSEDAHMQGADDTTAASHSVQRTEASQTREVEQPTDASQAVAGVSRDNLAQVVAKPEA